VGPRASAETGALWRAVHRSYRPFATMLLVEPGQRQEQLAARMPWTGAMAMVDGRPAAYVCRNFTCEAPTTRPEDLQQ
jgi:uncharacterized protein YyaL (SSP411 family)